MVKIPLLIYKHDLVNRLVKVGVRQLKNCILPGKKKTHEDKLSCLHGLTGEVSGIAVIKDAVDRFGVLFS